MVLQSNFHLASKNILQHNESHWVFLPSELLWYCISKCINLAICMSICLYVYLRAWGKGPTFSFSTFATYFTNPAIRFCRTLPLTGFLFHVLHLLLLWLSRHCAHERLCYFPLRFHSALLCSARRARASTELGVKTSNTSRSAMPP